MAKIEYDRAQLLTGEVTPRDYDEAQSQVEEFIDRLYRAVPFLDGNLLEDVELEPLVDNIINHKLGRNLRGWFIVKDQGQACSVSAYRTAARTGLASGSFHNIEADTENFDIGSNYDSTTNYQFTAPVDGEYHVFAQGEFSTITNARNTIGIFRNGSIVLQGSQVRSSTTSDVNGSQVSGLLHLDQDDTLDARVRHNDGGNRDLTVGFDEVNRFEVRLVRETWDDQDNNSDQENSLIIQTTYKHTVDLWVW